MKNIIFLFAFVLFSVSVSAQTQLPKDDFNTLTRVLTQTDLPSIDGNFGKSLQVTATGLGWGVSMNGLFSNNNGASTQTFAYTLGGNTAITGAGKVHSMTGLSTFQRWGVDADFNFTNDINIVADKDIEITSINKDIKFTGHFGKWYFSNSKVHGGSANNGDYWGLVDAATGESDWITPAAATKTQYEITVGSSVVRIDGQAGVTAAIAGGHITITVPSGINYPDNVSVKVANSDMTYTSSPFFPSNGFKVTIDNSANSTVSILESTTITKTLLGTPIGETTNPSQPINPLDANENLVTETGGIFSLVYNDGQAIFPNGAVIRF